MAAMWPASMPSSSSAASPAFPSAVASRQSPAFMPQFAAMSPSFPMAAGGSAQLPMAHPQHMAPQMMLPPIPQPISSVQQLPGGQLIFITQGGPIPPDHPLYSNYIAHFNYSRRLMMFEQQKKMMQAHQAAMQQSMAQQGKAALPSPSFASMRGQDMMQRVGPAVPYSQGMPPTAHEVVAVPNPNASLMVSPAFYPPSSPVSIIKEILLDAVSFSPENTQMNLNFDVSLQAYNDMIQKQNVDVMIKVYESGSPFRNTHWPFVNNALSMQMSLNNSLVVPESEQSPVFCRQSIKQGTNTLSLTQHNEAHMQNFQLVVAVVERLTLREAVDQKIAAARSVEECKQAALHIISRSPHGQEALLLLDRRTRRGLKAPARFLKCMHVSCFDLESSLFECNDGRQLQCPICKNVFFASELIVDRFIADVQKEIHKKVPAPLEIVIDASGGVRCLDVQESYMRLGIQPQPPPMMMPMMGGMPPHMMHQQPSTSTAPPPQKKTRKRKNTTPAPAVAPAPMPMMRMKSEQFEAAPVMSPGMPASAAAALNPTTPLMMTAPSPMAYTPAHYPPVNSHPPLSVMSPRMQQHSPTKIAAYAVCSPQMVVPLPTPGTPVLPTVYSQQPPTGAYPTTSRPVSHSGESSDPYTPSSVETRVPPLHALQSATDALSAASTEPSFVPSRESLASLSELNDVFTSEEHVDIDVYTHVFNDNKLFDDKRIANGDTPPQTTIDGAPLYDWKDVYELMQRE